MTTILFKKHIILLFSLFISFAALKAATIKVGNGVGEYTTLGAAFTAINNGVVSGDIIVQITKSTVETGTITLNKSYSPANYTSILIYPTVAGLSITANVNGSFIVLNGATNVTIDGRVNQAGTTNLSLINTNFSVAATASTIELKNSAAANTISYCNIKGSENIETSGIIRFSGSTIGTGNDNNIILGNYITKSTGGKPCNAIYSEGVSGYENDLNIIQNNRIYDCISTSKNSSAIYVKSYSNSFTISDNSIYETATVVPTLDYSYIAIRIGTSGLPLMSGFTVSGNFIGGTLPLGKGSKLTKTIAKNNTFYGIYMYVGNSSTSLIENNKINNISWSNSAGAVFAGINIAAGKVKVGDALGNKIGSVVGNDSIIYAVAGAIYGKFYGIYTQSADSVFINQNKIGSVKTSINNNVYSNNIYGIFKLNGIAGYLKISENQIGSTVTANSLLANSTATGTNQIVSGIYCQGTGVNDILLNTVSNLTNKTTSTYNANTINGITVTAGDSHVRNNNIYGLKSSGRNTGSNYVASVIGISLTGTAAAKEITSNVIYNLSNDYSVFAGYVIGVSFLGNLGTNVVNKNFIHSLSVNPLSVSGNIVGVMLTSGRTTLYDNIVSLGGSTKSNVYGIYATGAASNHNYIYFNTVSINGSLVSGAVNKSYALYSAASTNVRDFRNNVFSNKRSTIGGSNLHYAIYLNYGVSTNLTLNNNDYFVSGTGGVLGFFNGANKATLPIFTGSDANSFNVLPTFDNSTGTLATDYKMSSALIGQNIAGIPDDFGGENRKTSTNIGAWEGFWYKWTGLVNSNWGTSGNWKNSLVPVDGASIEFEATTQNNCVLDADHIISSLKNNTSFDMVLNTHKLSVRGDLFLSNGGLIDATLPNSTLEYAGENVQTISNNLFLNNQLYNLSINNAANVQLNGSISLLNNLTRINGYLDALSPLGEMIYDGAIAQSLDANVYLNDRIYKLVINNASGVLVNGDISVVSNLMINTGKKITIPVSKLLNVEGTITNNAGIGGLIINSASDSPNGSLIFHNPVESPVHATVSFNSKASWNRTTLPYWYKYQYIGIPFVSMPNITPFNGSYIFKYNEAGTDGGMVKRWLQLNNNSTMYPVEGYRIVQSAPKKYTITGQLFNSDVTRNLSYTPTAQYPGQHVISNPYTAAIKIQDIQLGTNVDSVIYLFNTGIYNPADPEGPNAGQYSPIPINLAGSSIDFPDEISSMQGFLVKTSAASTIGFTYSSVADINTTQMRIPKNAKKSYLKIDVKSANGHDKMWIFSEPNTTRGYDNGWDCYKLPEEVSSEPKIFAVESTGDFQINSVPDINETNLGFKSGDDSEYTLTITHNNLKSNYNAVYLLDLKDSTVVDISASGTEYVFNANNKIKSENRFKILTYKPNILNSKAVVNNSNTAISYDVDFFLYKNKLNIMNRSEQSGMIVVYNMFGSECLRIPFGSKNEYTTQLDLQSGAYIAKLIIGDRNFAKNLIIE